MSLDRSSLPYAATPAALLREAERQRHMARRATDCPVGYTRDAWERRCRRVAAQLATRAAQLDS